MAKARARTAARKVKDKWKAKNWYQIQASSLFDNAPIADTLTEKPANLINRVTEISLQDLTNDFRKSHIKLFFKVHKVEEATAQTQFIGHTLTSDYLRRMIRRRRSRIDGVYDIATRDGAYVRVKPFATTERRIQNSQKKVVREVMKKTVSDEGKAKTLNEFIKDILDGKIGSEIYKNCKNIYPVKRVDIYKTEVLRQPTIEVKEKKAKAEEKPEELEEKEEPKKKPVKKPKAKKKPASKKEEPAEKPEEEKPAKAVKKPKATKKETKKPAKKTKSTIKKVPAKPKTKKKAAPKKKKE